MPKKRECDYCGTDIEPGTGMMFVRTNGSTIDYCSAKCEKNADLGREARDLNWTAAGRESDRQQTVAAEREAEEDAAAAEEESDTAPDLEAAESEADEEAEADDESAEADAEDESEDEDEQAEEAQA